MSQADAMIAIDPPLPWIAEDAMGFVTGIGRQGLKLSHTSATGLTLRELQIALADGKILRLKGVISNKAQDYFTPDHDSQILLAELRGKLRKAQHIDICATKDVEASDRFTGFSLTHFMPAAFPELNENDLDTNQYFLGRRFSLPLLITGMTGGIEQGAIINHRLARAAADFNIPMGVGSQRIALEEPQLAKIFAVKQEVKNLFLIANLGAAQLLSKNRVDLCQRAISMIDADAIAIHINVLQECVQVEGDRNFRGLLAAIEEVCQKVDAPVIVKEVGAGIDSRSARALIKCGVSALDVGGRGGTSWGYIEGLRSSDIATKELALTFRDWGIPTAYALAGLRLENKDLPIVATGGIRDGLMVAKAVALGANLVGIGLPLLRAALHSQDQTHAAIENLARGLSTTMLATGSKTLSDLSAHICFGLPGAEAFNVYKKKLTQESAIIPNNFI